MGKENHVPTGIFFLYSLLLCTSSVLVSLSWLSCILPFVFTYNTQHKHPCTLREFFLFCLCTLFVLVLVFGFCPYSTRHEMFCKMCWCKRTKYESKVTYFYSHLYRYIYTVPTTYYKLLVVSRVFSFLVTFPPTEFSTSALWLSTESRCSTVLVSCIARSSAAQLRTLYLRCEI